MNSNNMPRVDFYILPDDNRRSIQNFACDLVEKAYLQGQKVLLKTESANESRLLDDLLWTRTENNFIPHAIYDASTFAEQTILIHHGNEPVKGFQLLINLSSSAEQHQQVDRIAEILNQQAQCKQTGREHYKIYRELGFDLHHQQINH
jgi:DNA polymerase-3 subunit chi